MRPPSDMRPSSNIRLPSNMCLPSNEGPPFNMRPPNKPSLNYLNKLSLYLCIWHGIHDGIDYAFFGLESIYLGSINFISRLLSSIRLRHISVNS